MQKANCTEILLDKHYRVFIPGVMARQLGIIRSDEVFIISSLYSTSPGQGTGHHTCIYYQLLLILPFLSD